MADDTRMGKVTPKKAAASKSKARAKVAKKTTAKAKTGKTVKKKVSRIPPDLEVDPDVLELIAAIDKYKKSHNRPFPSWSEVLYILRKLGYTKG